MPYTTFPLPDPNLSQKAPMHIRWSTGVMCLGALMLAAREIDGGDFGAWAQLLRGGWYQQATLPTASLYSYVGGQVPN